MMWRGGGACGEGDLYGEGLEVFRGGAGEWFTLLTEVIF